MSGGLKGYLQRLKDKWGVESAGQFAIIMIVFACTGLSVMFLKRPITNLLFGDGEWSTTFTVLYWILILPVYNVLLLFYGFVFGQFRFFWEFEKRFFRRFTGRQ